MLIELLNQFKNNNFISAYSFWSLGFVFIIILDGIISKNEIINSVGNIIYFKTGILFLISQLIIIFFYKNRIKKSLINSEIIKVEITKKIRSFFVLIIFLLFIIFVASELPKAYESLFNSRFELLLNSEQGGINSNKKSVLFTIFGFISSFSGYILPALMFIILTKKTSNFKALLLASFFSLIIWFVFISIGTRHNIVYSFLILVGSYSLLNVNKIKFKVSYILLIVVGFILSNTIVEARRHGLINYITGNKIEKYLRTEKNKAPTTDKTVKYMSYVVDYYENNDYRLGQSTSALLFFWVPRKFWNEKPPQFGFWFIREYLGGQKGFGDKFSAPASYLGVPYSDFGILGIFIVSILIGYILFKVDIYFTKNKTIQSHKTIIIVSFCLASFFFLPRQLSQFFTKFIVILIFLNVLFYFNKFYLKLDGKQK